MRLLLIALACFTVAVLSQNENYYISVPYTTTNSCISATIPQIVYKLNNCYAGSTYSCNSTHVITSSQCNADCSTCSSVTAATRLETCTDTSGFNTFALRSCVVDYTPPNLVLSLIIYQDANCAPSTDAAYFSYFSMNYCSGTYFYDCSQGSLTASPCTDSTCASGSCSGTTTISASQCNNQVFAPQTTAPYVPITSGPPTNPVSSRLTCAGVTDAPTAAPTAPPTAVVTTAPPTSIPTGSIVTAAPTTQSSGTTAPTISGGTTATPTTARPGTTLKPTTQAPSNSGNVLSATLFLALALFVMLFA